MEDRSSRRVRTLVTRMAPLIDYYDERCEYGSLDPTDPEKTTRALTLMLAEDY
jgi:hypothetical protein